MRYLLSILAAVLIAGTAAAQTTDDSQRGWLLHQVPGGSDTFTGDITLENDETISNSTDGSICFGADSGEDLCLDLDGTDLVDITTNTGVLLVDFQTINLATDGLDLSDGSITNVGDIALDSITADTTSGGITMGGTGAASTESLLWKFGEYAERIDVSSPSGAYKVDWGILDHYGSDLSLSGDIMLEGGGSIITSGNGDINLTPNGTGVVVLGGLAGYANLYAGQIQTIGAGIISGTYMQAAAASYFEHATRTKWTSSGNGIWEMGINDGTQGIRFDAATTADRLLLSDQDGNDIFVQAYGVDAVVEVRSSIFRARTPAVGVALTSSTQGGAAASGPVAVYSGNQVAGNYASGDVSTYTGTTVGTVKTGDIAIYSGIPGNAGDVDSGTITYCSTGATTTDGDTGDCIAQTGASGDGTGVDAGDHIWNVNGANEAMKIAGATGVLSLQQAPVFADYTRHHDVPIGAAIVGAAAPGQETIGTFRCYVFDANADLAHVSVEVPSEWNGSSDMAIDLLIFTDDGDALGNGEVIEFDLVYRSVDEGQAYDNGAAVTIEATVTGGGAETDKGQYKISATVDYDDSDQPLAVNDTLGFSIMRDVDDSDTYSGDVHVCRAQLVYTANALATH